MKFRCKDCGTEIELPPAPETVREVVKKEPCRCGLTPGTRMARYAALAFTGFLLLLAADCASSHYWTTRQIEILKGDGYQIRDRSKASLPASDLINGVPFDVQKKDPPPEKK